MNSAVVLRTPTDGIIDAYKDLYVKALSSIPISQNQYEFVESIVNRSRRTLARYVKDVKVIINAIASWRLTHTAYYSVGFL